MTKSTNRLAWERLERQCDEAQHARIWNEVSFGARQLHPDFWVSIMDRIVDRAWRRFSREVSGNEL